MGGGLVADDLETGPGEYDWKHERTLVLVGRTGNGKSATGNSILGETKFLSQASAKSITKECKLHSSELPNGLTSVNVIDTPGLFSACSTKEFTSREIVSCLRLARDGIDAVLLVFSLRNRLTEEEQSTLRILKILFGSQIVNHIIVVFTNGDVLSAEQTLEDYLQDSHEFQEILKECDDRKVMFDNRSEISESKKEKQVKDLLNLVEQISKNNGNSYMADLSLELKEKQQQIDAMKAKQETSELKELEKSYKKMLKGMEEKVSNQLKESIGDVKDQLLKAEATRKEAEKKMNDIQKLSADEIKKLRKQLDKALKETKDLRAKLENKRCTIL